MIDRDSDYLDMFSDRLSYSLQRLFAFLPTKLNNGKLVWLRWMNAVVETPLRPYGIGPRIKTKNCGNFETFDEAWSQKNRLELIELQKQDKILKKHEENRLRIEKENADYQRKQQKPLQNPSSYSFRFPQSGRVINSMTSDIDDSVLILGASLYASNEDSGISSSHDSDSSSASDGGGGSDGGDD